MVRRTLGFPAGFINQNFYCVIWVNNINVTGSINAVDNFSTRYLTRDKYSLKGSEWVLDGTIESYSAEGMPTVIKRAKYSPGGIDYMPAITLNWNSKRELKSRVYNGWTETYGYKVRNPTQIINHDNISTTIVYDERRRVIGKSANNGNITTTYDYGHLSDFDAYYTMSTTFSDGTPPQLEKTYIDGFGNPLRSLKNNKAATSFIYDAMFRTKEKIDRASGRTTFKYQESPIGELMETKDAVGNITKTMEIGTNNDNPYYTGLITTDPNNSVSKVFKNSLGNIRRSVSGMNGITQYNYNSHQLIEEIVNPIGEIFHYQYNNLDLPVSVTMPVAQNAILTYYDDRYRVAAVRKSNGKYFVNTYDDYNRILNVKMHDNIAFSNSMLTPSELSTYQNSGINVQSNTYTPGKSWVESTSEIIFKPGVWNQYKITSISQRDDIGRVINSQASYPNGAIQNHNVYNDADQIKSVENTYNISGIGIYSDKNESEYDNELRLYRQYLTTDATSRRLIAQSEYDWRDRLMTKWQDQDELQEINYDYDDAGKLIAINQGITTECLQNKQLCDYEITIGFSFNQPFSRIAFGSNAEYTFPAPIYAYFDPSALAAQISIGLNNFGFGGSVTYQMVIEDHVTFFIKGTLADQVSLKSAIGQNYPFTKVKCCAPAPDNDHNGPGGTGTTNLYDAKDLFSESIRYQGLNIEQIDQQNVCNFESFINNYQYDADHRVTNVNNKVRLGGIWINGAYNESHSYDLAGNILTLSRKAITNFSSNTAAFIDNLAFSYTNSKLNLVTDAAPAGSQAMGLKPASSTYGYEAASGNLTSDNGKQFTVEYNPIDLPRRFIFPTGKVNVIYTFGGEKIMTEDSLVYPQAPGATVVFPVRRWYFGALECNASGRLVLHHPEGRLACVPGKSCSLEYTIKDHLGNSVVTYSDNNANHHIDAGEVLQRNLYYAFGMEINGNWQNVTPGNDNNYLYNGKELQEWGTSSGALNWQDYGTRWYMPEIGRWNGIDPKAAKYAHASPYNYCLNNPLLFIDPDGEDIIIREVRGDERASAKRTFIHLQSLTSEKLSFDSRTGKVSFAKGVGNAKASAEGTKLVRDLISDISKTTTITNDFKDSGFKEEFFKNNALTSAIDGSSGNAANGVGSSSIVYFSPDIQAKFTDVNMEKQDASPDRVLAHELIHADNNRQGVRKVSEKINDPLLKNQEEKNAVKRENIMFEKQRYDGDNKK